MNTLKLLLPVLIPSWRFFDIIAPSPRIEYALLETADAAPETWQEFRPRPDYLSLPGMLKRLFWNPQWNESLFMASCAERLMQNPAEHSSREIFGRIKAELHGSAPYLQFRLVFLSRQGEEMHRNIAYVSPVERRSG